jgi:hypothetical protein
MTVKVKEESTEIFNNVFAWCMNEIVEHCLFKIPISHTGKLSPSTCDHTSAIHIVVVIKDALHLVNKVYRPSVAAFDDQVEKNPEK